jgi:hypothetical protein
MGIAHVDPGEPRRTDAATVLPIRLTANIKFTASNPTSSAGFKSTYE